MKNARTVLLVAVMAGVLAWARHGQARCQETSIARSAGVVAYVNGRPIPSRVFEQAMAQRVDARNQTAVPPGADRSGLQQQQRQRVLRALINAELLYQESRARGIQVNDSEIALEMEVLRRSPMAFSEVLAFPDEPPELLAGRIARKLAIEKLIDQVTSTNAAVEPQRIRELYESHREEFLRKEQVRLGHILLRVAAQDPPLAKDRQRERMEEFRRRIVGGDEFSAVARCCSDELDSAQRGGDKGYFARGELPAVIEDAAFHLAVGEVSQVIEDADGYHLVRVLAHLPERYASLEEVEAPVRAYFDRNEKQQRLQKLLETLESRATVVVVTQQ